MQTGEQAGVQLCRSDAVLGREEAQPDPTAV